RQASRAFEGLDRESFIRMNQRRRSKSTADPSDLAVFALPTDSEPIPRALNFAPESSLAGRDWPRAQSRRYPRGPRDPRKIPGRDRVLRRGPRAADRDHIGQREIGGGIAKIDTAGRTEFELRTGRRDRFEPGNAARGLGRKEFEHAKAERT